MEEQQIAPGEEQIQNPAPTPPLAPQQAPAQPASQPEVSEISYEEALKQDEQPAQEAQQEQPEDVVDILRPKAEPRSWTIGKGQMERTYIQRPLSFMQKMQWFSLVGEVLDQAMSGEDRLSLNNLFSAPSTRGSQLSMEDFRDADTFVQAVGKLLVHAPDFLTKSYCIWLGVPDYERPLVKELMELPPDEGGLTDDEGFEMIEIFIDQNYEALDRFFREKLAGLADRIQARQKAAAKSRQSRR